MRVHGTHSAPLDFIAVAAALLGLWLVLEGPLVAVGMAGVAIIVVAGLMMLFNHRPVYHLRRRQHPGAGRARAAADDETTDPLVDSDRRRNQE